MRLPCTLFTNRNRETVENGERPMLEELCVQTACATGLELGRAILIVYASHDAALAYLLFICIPLRLSRIRSPCSVVSMERSRGFEGPDFPQAGDEECVHPQRPSLHVPLGQRRKNQGCALGCQPPLEKPGVPAHRRELRQTGGLQLGLLGYIGGFGERGALLTGPGTARGHKHGFSSVLLSHVFHRTMHYRANNTAAVF